MPFQSPKKSLRITIAEDEFLIAEELRMLIEDDGHRVVDVVRTGGELIAAVERRRPDLALVDVKLARGSDGLAAARTITERHNVPAIAVTAHLEPERAREAGLLGLLPKPYAASALRDTLYAAAEWLEKGHLERASGAFLFVRGRTHH